MRAQVAKLERELGQPLLDRAGRAVRLTSTGDAVPPLAWAALASLDAIGGIADELARLVRGRVRMGMIRGCSIPPFLDALAAFRIHYPDVELDLVEADSSDLQRLVRSGELDLALIGYAGHPRPRTRRDGRDRRVARGAHVQRASLRAQTAGQVGRPAHRVGDVLAEGTGVRSAFDRSCADAGISLTIDLVAGSPETLLGLAARGAGVAVLTAAMAAGTELCLRPLVDAWSHARRGLIARQGPLTSATRQLRVMCTEALTGGSLDGR